MNINSFRNKCVYIIENSSKGYIKTVYSSLSLHNSILLSHLSTPANFIPVASKNTSCGYVIQKTKILTKENTLIYML